MQTDEKGKSFSFKLLRHYEGTDESERVFLEGLWEYGSVVSKKELENSFYQTLSEVVKEVRNAWEKKIFYKNSLWWRMITFPFAIIPYVVGLFGVIRWVNGDTTEAFIFSIGHGIAASVLTLLMIGKKRKILVRIIMGLALVGLIVVFSLIMKSVFNYMGVIYWVVYASCVIAGMLQMVFYCIIDKRTDYGIDLLGRINGFKRYLETAERPHLVALVEQDPEYYYKILPYTYVLGVSDKWISKFEAIQLQAPDWYGGHYYNLNDFADRMDRTMASANRSMTSSPSESSGGGSSGGSSGGGSSGGGSGGGGGGAW